MGRFIKSSSSRHDQMSAEAAERRRINKIETDRLVERASKVAERLKETIDLISDEKLKQSAQKK